MMYLANKYNSTLTGGYTVGQTVLNVSAVPENVPTLIMAAKGTDKETIFAVTGRTINTLTGVTRLRGAKTNLDSSTPLTCINLVEFINQFSDAATGKASGETVNLGEADDEIVTPEAIANSYITNFKAEHNEDGAHKSDTITTLGIAGPDGWIVDSDTWVYVSATAFKIEGKDVRTRFPKGTKIKWKEGTKQKYGTVLSSAFSNDTTIGLVANSDYSLSNKTISDNHYSNYNTPQGFPNFFNFDPNPTGFSGTPTHSGIFATSGSLITISLDISGISNAATLGFSPPVPLVRYMFGGWVVEPSVSSLPCFLESVGNNVNVFKDGALSAWASSGNKRVVLNYTHFF